MDNRCLLDDYVFVAADDGQYWKFVTIGRLAWVLDENKECI